jgi:glycosyltransferase involved in cell wall biosynthesis
MSLENERPLKILMIAPSLPPGPIGGAEKQALRLAGELYDRGISVSFITPGKKKETREALPPTVQVYPIYSVLNALFDFFSRMKKRKVRTLDKIEYDDRTETTDEITRNVGWPTVIYYNLFFWQSLLFLWRKTRQFDIIHAHTMEWSAIVAVQLGKMLRKPVVIKDSTMNGFSSLRRYPDGHRIQQKIARGATFVAMTEIIEQNLINAGIPKEQIVKIPNGIVINRESARPVASNDLKVLFVGNLYQQPAKGVDILLKAWRLVLNQHPTAILQIAGEGVTPLYRAYVEQLGIAPSIQFLGNQSLLDTYWASATLFVLPSRREGMSNALMEAMLHGLPCIATDISGSADLISNGVNGILVPAKDTAALAAGICYMLSHPAEAQDMGCKARETIRRDFDMRIIAGKYIDLYHKLVNGNYKN